MRAQTYVTLIALLASTGLRVSEALKLRIADITDDGLIIRETKFRKTRLVPLHDTAAAELQRYLMHRRQVGIGDDPVFVGRRGRALPYSAVQCTFKTVLKAAGICTPPGRHRPACMTFGIRSP
jgi:integrase